MQDLVVTSLMKNGIEFSSSTLSMVPGVPIKPMLAKYLFFDIFPLRWLYFICNTSLFMGRMVPYDLVFIPFFCYGRITNGVSQALKLFENKAFTCEYK